MLGAAAAPLALLLAGRARAGGTPLALVTADLESHVAAVHMSSGSIYRRLATLEDPRSIEGVGGHGAVVAHTSEGAVTLIDALTLEIRRVLRDFGAPRYTATRSDARYAFLTDSARGDVAVLDVRAGRVVARVDVGGPARHVSLDRAGRSLWVALGTKAAEVAVVEVTDPRRPRFLHRLRPPFLAHDVGFAPGGRRVWVTSGDRGTVAIYDAASRRLVRRFAAGSPPQHVTFLGGRAYVTSGDDGSVTVHRLDGRVLGTAGIPVGSYNVQDGFGLVLTPSLANGMLTILGASGRSLRRVHAARSSHDACFVMSR